eukprot:Skav220146  [mRNA]  locus=scaffold1320:417550:436226:+ [translate_table: standard]
MRAVVKYHLGKSWSTLVDLQALEHMCCECRKWFENVSEQHGNTIAAGHALHCGFDLLRWPNGAQTGRIAGNVRDEGAVQSWNEQPLLDRVVSSNGFEACSMMSIMLCIFFLGADAACFNSCSAGTQVFYEVMNQLFVLAFLVEWILRVLKDGKNYFVPLKAEHVLDTVIVWLCGVLLGWIIPLAVADVQSSPITQSLNVLRSMRTLRFFAFLKHFETFKMLLTGILGTYATLAACVALLFMIDLL